MHHATTHEPHCRNGRFLVPHTRQRRPRGRPPAADSPEERRKHIGALMAFEMGVSIRALAIELERSDRMVYHYINRAKSYGPEVIAQALAEAEAKSESRASARALARAKSRAAAN